MGRTSTRELGYEFPVDPVEWLGKRAVDAMCLAYDILDYRRTLMRPQASELAESMNIIPHPECTVRTLKEGKGLEFFIPNAPGSNVIGLTRSWDKEITLRAKVRDYWFDVLFQAVRNTDLSRVSLPFQWPVAVVFEWVKRPKKQRDLDNQISYKAFVDALIWTGVLQEDDAAHVQILAYMTDDSQIDRARLGLKVTVVPADEVIDAVRSALAKMKLDSHEK